MSRIVLSAAFLCACSTSLLGLPSRDVVARYIASGSGTQHACVISYGRGMRAPNAWVYWEEGRRLAMWSPDDREHMGRELDLDTHDAAARAWIDDLLRDCRASGVRYTIARPADPGAGSIRR